MLITILIFGGLEPLNASWRAQSPSSPNTPICGGCWLHPLAPGAAEEILRYEPAGAGAPRRVVSDFAFEGLDFNEGDVVLPSTMAANRDPRVFENADTFDHRPRGATQL